MKKVSNIIKMCFGYNNALLSGSMDIIVVKQPSGKLKASPLRLRFSNYRVPKAGKKKVIVKVNGKLVNAPMFLQKDGKAFILSEFTDFLCTNKYIASDTISLADLYKPEAICSFIKLSKLLFKDISILNTFKLYEEL